MLWLIVIPIIFALLRMITRRYIFSALTTLSCALMVLPYAPILCAGLIVSAIGDYFMAHRRDNTSRYVAAILFFFAGHLLFIIDAARRTRTLLVPIIIGVIMLIGYAYYVIKRILPKVPAMMKIPVVLYTLVSLAGFTCAMTTCDGVYIASIALLLFSDTMIAEGDFAGNKKSRILILPTYYLCHILMVVSVFLR